MRIKSTSIPGIASAVSFSVAPTAFPLSGAILVGSDWLLVHIASLQWHHPSAEQLNSGAAIHGSLEGFQFVDLSLGLPVAPGLRHSVPHRLQVLAYRLRKTLHRVDPGRARIDQPCI